MRAHIPEKWEPIFRKGYAPLNNLQSAIRSKRALLAGTTPATISNQSDFRIRSVGPTGVRRRRVEPERGMRLRGAGHVGAAAAARELAIGKAQPGDRSAEGAVVDLRQVEA